MKNSFFEQLSVPEIDTTIQNRSMLSKEEEDFASYLNIIEFETGSSLSIDEAVELYYNINEDEERVHALSDDQLNCAIYIVYEAILFKRMRIEQLRNGSTDVLLMDKDELIKMRMKARQLLKEDGLSSQ